MWVKSRNFSKSIYFILWHNWGSITGFLDSIACILMLVFLHKKKEWCDYTHFFSPLYMSSCRVHITDCIRVTNKWWRSVQNWKPYLNQKFWNYLVGVLIEFISSLWSYAWVSTRGGMTEWGGAGLLAPSVSPRSLFFSFWYFRAPNWHRSGKVEDEGKGRRGKEPCRCVFTPPLCRWKCWR